jgi:hypothetical protein
MHHLHEDATAAGVHGVRDLLPPGDLGVALDARRVDIAFAHGGGENAFRDDQAGAGALGVVGDGHVADDAIGIGPGTGHRRHDQMVREFVAADSGAGEKLGHDLFRQGGFGCDERIFH